ncbi:hypothetical protein [Zavarzinella formosa]|uniref:hypothetical protein n=1 Tax=Zavarzinella formosa TaxID=360055 RepID=UPI0012FCB10A|nr:hypothetical protein [Zavarzinella formosa]
MTPDEAKQLTEQAENRIRAEAVRDSLALAMDVLHILQSVQGYAAILTGCIGPDPRAARHVEDLRGVAERGMEKLREFVSKVKSGKTDDADEPVIREN